MTYSSNPAQGQCSPCPFGSFSNSTGATTCQICQDSSQCGCQTSFF
jgi:hypothetical protein